LNGRLTPGQHLLEEELAETLQVSRGPVRQALSQLEHEGLVIVRRNRGAFVARLSPADADEVYSLRMALERLAARSAVDKATAEDLAALEEAVAETRRNRDRMSPREAADLDIQFHDLVFRAAHHERLWDFWSKLRSQVFIVMLTISVNDEDYIGRLADEHQLILEALLARSRNLAAHIVQDHITRGFGMVKQGLLAGENADMAANQAAELHAHSASRNKAEA
jgi:DNA-binding GntR family transcriptional regulator